MFILINMFPVKSCPTPDFSRIHVLVTMAKIPRYRILPTVWDSLKKKLLMIKSTPIMNKNRSTRRETTFCFATMKTRDVFVPRYTISWLPE